MAMQKLERLMQIIGYQFKNPTLLKQALTHRSIGPLHNERLELLGDAVLGMIITTALFKRYPNASEGELSHRRATLVCEKSLVALAEQLSIGRYIRLGVSELGQRNRNRPALLADTVEAIIGAIYQDADWLTCNTCILNWYQELLETVEYVKVKKDPKTALQEYLQGNGHATPHYYVVSQVGDAHDSVFTVNCKLPATVSIETRLGTGVGKNRRAAEQEAAAKLLLLLGEKSYTEYINHDNNEQLVTP